MSRSDAGNDGGGVVWVGCGWGGSGYRRAVHGVVFVAVDNGSKLLDLALVVAQLF